MLKLLLGTDWIANRNEILNRVASDVHCNCGNRILIVPELISHEAERRLCSVAGDAASRYAEVLSFSRIADRIASASGRRKPECLDDGGRIVAMAAAVRQLNSKLKAYASLETRPEFLCDLVSAIDEFKCCLITPEDIRGASAALEGNLAQKLEEIGLIYETYDSLCNTGIRDPRDVMSWVLEQLDECEFAQEHVFYIDGFPDLTRQHMAVLEHLIMYSPLVTVSLNCDRPDSDSVAFEKAGDTASQMIRFAKLHDIEIEIQIVSPRDSALNPVRQMILDAVPKYLDLGDRIQAFRAETLRQECVAAAEKILELVQNGSRYRDISVVCADMVAYKGTIDIVFRRCGIPVYLAGTEDLLEKNAITAVLSAVEAALGGFERRDVMRYLKSMLSPLSPEICDRVEHYTFVWNINGSMWLKEWTSHPGGLGNSWRSADRDLLSELNAARISAVEPLRRFADRFHAAVNMGQQVTALYELFAEIHLADTFEDLAARMDSKGEKRNAQILNQLWDILMTALEQLYGILGQFVWDADTFTQLLKLLLGQYSVGTIPPALDTVSVGPVSAMRCQETEHLLILGALEGKFPCYGSAVGVLTDKDRSVLRKLGVPVNDGSIVGLQAEFAEIYGVFGGANASISMYCPAGQPSYIFKRFSVMSGGENNVQCDLGAALTDTIETGAYLSRMGAERAAESLGLKEIYDRIDKQKLFNIGHLTAKTAESLYGSVMKLSASQFDKFAECRMSYFLRYGMRIKDWEIAEISPAEFGTFVHDVLENTVRSVMEQGGFRKVSLEKTLLIAKEYTDRYMQDHFEVLNDDRLTYLMNRNLVELELIVGELWDEMQTCLFEPFDYELKFGDDGKLPAIVINGETVTAHVRGSVDRVDLWINENKRYVRVVDYKTGEKSFDYCDLASGRGLQMLIYLFALDENSEDLFGQTPLPAGVLYFPARAPFVNKDFKPSEEEAERIRAGAWKRSGMLLLDEAVLCAMDTDETYQRMPIQTGKDGSVSGDIASSGQFSDLKKFVFSTLRNMVDEISSGNISANPYGRGSEFDACTYCPYGTICHKNLVTERRNYKAISRQEFWEKVDTEVNKHG